MHSKQSGLWWAKKLFLTCSLKKSFMSMKLIVLGTSASNPTVERSLSSTALQFEGEWLLFDCPEGTQRQMMKAGVSYMKVRHVFISHFHADHFLGLPGLIATMSMHGRDYPLHVFGPLGIKEQIKKILSLALFKQSFEINAKEIRKGEILEEEKFFVEAVPLKHEVKCFGFVFKEKDKEGEFQRKKAEQLGIPEGMLWSKLQRGETVKFKEKTIKPEQVMDYSKKRRGKKVSIILDTLPFDGYVEAVRDSDVLVHEATFLDKMELRARQTKHSTARQAAAIAEKAGCKRLVLTHFSPRHRDEKEIENQARQEFANVVVAKDLMEIEI